MYFNRIKDIYNHNGNIPDLWRDVQIAHRHGVYYIYLKSDRQTDRHPCAACVFVSWSMIMLTLSLLWYLKTRICWGGWSIWPPLQIPCLMSKYDKWYIIEKLLCSTFKICKKICKFSKIEFFIAKSSYIVKIFAKK